MEKDQLSNQITDTLETSPAVQKQKIEVAPAVDLSDTELPNSDTQPAPYYGGSVIKDLPTSATPRKADGSEGNPLYYNDDNRFIPVDPYKIVLPAMQREVTISSMDPKKAAFDLATSKLGINKNEFIGYEHVDPNLILSHVDAAKLLSSVYQGNVRSKMYITKDDVIELENAERVREFNEARFQEGALDWSTISKGLSEGGDFLLKSLYSTLGYGAKGIGNVATALQVLYESADDSVQFSNKTFIGELARNWERAFETTEKNSLGKNIPSRIEDGYIGNKIWNIASQTVDSVNLSTSLNDEENQLIDPTFPAKVVNGIATSLPLMPMFLVNPAVASTVVGAGVSDNITRNLLDQGYTFSEANARGLFGGGIVGASSFLSWKVSEAVMDSALRALGKGVFGTAAGVAGVAATEGTTEIFEERVERALAEAGNPIKNFFGPLSEDDAVVFLAAAATSLFGESPKIRMAYKDRTLVQSFTEEEKKEFNRLVPIADAYKDTLVARGLSNEQAKEAMIKLVSEGPEFIDSYINEMFAGAKDRVDTGEFEESTSQLLDKLSPNNIEDAVKRELAELRVKAEKKYSEPSVGLTEQEQKLMVAVVLNRAIQNAALTGESVLDYKLPEIHSINRPASDMRGEHIVRYKDGVEIEYQPSWIKINRGKTGEYESAFDQFSSKEKFLDVIWTLTHELMHEDFFQNSLNMDKDTWRAYTRELIGYIERTFDKRQPGDDASKAIEYLETDPEGARDSAAWGATGFGKYTNPSNPTEWAAQAVTRLGPDAKEMFGLSNTNQAWQMVAAVERAIAGMNDVTPLTTGLQNFVQEFNKFVKDNSEKIKDLVRKKGTRHLNAAIKSLLSGNADALNWKKITYDDLMEFAKLTELPLDAEAIEAVRRSLDGVQESDWFKLVSDMWDEGVSGINKKTEAESDIEEIDLNDLIDPFDGIVNQEKMIGYQANPTAQYDQPSLVDEKGKSLIGSGEGGEAHMRGSYFLKDKFRDKAMYYYLLGFRNKSIPLKAKINFGKTDDYGNFEKTIALDHDSVMKIFGNVLYDELIKDDAIQHFVNWETPTYMVVVSGKEKFKSPLEKYATGALEANGVDLLSDEEYGISDIRSVEISIADDAGGQIMEALLPDQDLMFEEKYPMEKQTDKVRDAVTKIANEVIFDSEGFVREDIEKVVADDYSITSHADIFNTGFRPYDLFELLKDIFKHDGHDDPGESVRELFVKHGIEGNHYFGGRDGEGWVVFDPAKVEPRRVARGVKEVVNFEQVATTTLANDFLNELAAAKKEAEKPETAFTKQMTRKVGGKTLEEDFEEVSDIIKNTKHKRIPLFTWLSERRGIVGNLFSLGGMDLVKKFGVEVKRQLFRDLYEERMSNFRSKALAQLFNNSKIDYDKFFRTYTNKTIKAEVFNPDTTEVEERMVSPDEIAYAMLVFEQPNANGHIRAKMTYVNYDELVAQLTPEQKEFAYLMRKDLEDVLIKDIRESAKYGARTTKIHKNYFPIVAHIAVSDERPISTLSFMSRKETTSPIGVIGAAEVFGRYHGRIAGGKSGYFATVDRIQELFDFSPKAGYAIEDEELIKGLHSKSRALNSVATNIIGVKGLANIKGNVDLVKNGSVTREIGKTWMSGLGRVITPALLAFRPKNFVANFSNILLTFGAPNVDSYPELVSELVKAAGDLNATHKEFFSMANGMFAHRFKNINTMEFTQRGATQHDGTALDSIAKAFEGKDLTKPADFATVLSTVSSGLEKFSMLTSTTGDYVSNIIGAVALHRLYKKQNLRKGMSETDAEKAAADDVVRFVLYRQSSTNQAMKPTTVVRWNQQGGIMPGFAQFAGESIAKSGQIGMDIQGAAMGEISVADATKDIAAIIASQIMYRAVQAGALGLAASAIFGEATDEEKEFVMENFADGCVQEVLDLVAGPWSSIASPVALSIIKDRSYGTNIPAVSLAQRQLMALKKVGEGIISPEKAVDAKDLIPGIGFGMTYGSIYPAFENTMNVARGIYLRATGDTEAERKKGLYMALGYTERAADKASGKKKVDKKSAIK